MRKCLANIGHNCMFVIPMQNIFPNAVCERTDDTKALEPEIVGDGCCCDSRYFCNPALQIVRVCVPDDKIEPVSSEIPERELFI